MHDIKKLEEKWFTYKVKQLILPMLKISGVYLVFVSGYYVYQNNSNTLMGLLPSNNVTNVLGVSIDSNSSSVQNNMLSKVVEHKKKEKVSEKNQELDKIALAPIIPVIDMLKEERIPENKRKKVIRKSTKKHSRTHVASNMVKAKKNTYLTSKELAAIAKSKSKSKSKVEVVPTKTAPRKTKKIHFTSTKNNYLDRMKQKFSKSNSPRDALLIANNYYNKADYVASEKWALTANKLDNSLEKSWFVFAKSKSKLGKRREAVKILVNYYKKSNSTKAKQLIGQIKAGRI